MDFPADPVEPVEAPAALHEGLNGAQATAVLRSERDLLVRLSSAEAVRDLEPNLGALGTLEDTRGVIATAPAGTEDADFVSRFFAPAVGVPEDPVTGSAHCALGPYWARETGRTALTGRQISSRGGTVRVRLSNPDAERVTLGGQAQTVVRGRLDT